MPKFFLIAGETSGDKHGAELVKQLRLRYPDARFAALGGDEMEAAGCFLYQHIRHMAFMGLAAVLQNIGQVRRNFRMAQEALLKEKPDVLVLMDYPSFNLQMASFCRKHLPHTKIIYYIPPKVWASRRRRIHRLGRICDRILGIFPFEPGFYARYGYQCTYVGNPTVEEIRHYNALEDASPRSSATLPTDARPNIALLPGSRLSEISNCLPRMLAAARRFPDYRIVVAAAQGIDDAFYRPYLRENEMLTRDTYKALQAASAAVVNSGTATLETALLGCPQVAVYHLACSGLIGLIRRAQPLFFSIPYFTLVNIIAGKEVIRECIANDFTEEKVTTELRRLLTDEAYTKEMRASYAHLSSLLGSQPASSTAADNIAACLQ